MKKITIALLGAFLIVLSGCKGGDSTGAEIADTHAGTHAKNSELYFDFTVDGKPVSVDVSDIMTTYNEFGASNIVFKVFAGKEDGAHLVLTIPHDMSQPSSTPSGSPEAGSEIFQGSVSLQGYPEKGDTFNSYDGFVNPKPEPVADTIVITASERIGDEARVITGTVNAKAGAHTVAGKFRVKHEFSGIKF